MKKLAILFFVLFLTSGSKPNAIKWVAIGDSITYLNNHLDETDFRLHEGYMTRVVKKMPHISYENQGHNGWTASRIAQKIDELGIQRADVYSVFLSTNDWWAGIPVGTISDFENNTGNQTVFGAYRIILDKIKSLNPKAKVILVSPMPRVDFVYVANYKNNAFGSYKDKKGENLEAFANAIITIGKLENMEVIDLYHQKKLDYKYLVNFKRLKNPSTGQYQNYTYPEYIGIPFNPETDEYPYPMAAINMTFDGLHPSDKGNELIAKAIIKIMRKY
jgi:lysophospholipase L1-like esterase